VDRVHLVAQRAGAHFLASGEEVRGGIEVEGDRVALGGGVRDRLFLRGPAEVAERVGALERLADQKDRHVAAKRR
jgi:hypothetical protein